MAIGLGTAMILSSAMGTAGGIGGSMLNRQKQPSTGVQMMPPWLMIPQLGLNFLTLFKGQKRAEANRERLDALLGQVGRGADAIRNVGRAGPASIDLTGSPFMSGLFGDK